MVRTVLFLNPADSFIPPLEQRVFAGNSFSLGPVDQRSFNRLLNVFVGDVVIKVVQLQWIRTHVVEFRLLTILAIQREFPIAGLKHLWYASKWEERGFQPRWRPDRYGSMILRLSRLDTPIRVEAYRTLEISDFRVESLK